MFVLQNIPKEKSLKLIISKNKRIPRHGEGNGKLPEIIPWNVLHT